MSNILLRILYLVQSALKSAFVLQGPGIPSVPSSGGGFSPGQSQVSSQDQEKVCVLFYNRRKGGRGQESQAEPLFISTLHH